MNSAERRKHADDLVQRKRKARKLAQLTQPDRAAEADWATTLHFLALFELDEPVDWQQMSGYAWVQFLSAYPQWAGKVPNWKKLLTKDLADLLRAQPQLSDHVLNWEDFKPLDLACLLMVQPQFAARVRNWGAWQEKHWRLLARQPQLAQYRPQKEE
jgi:hypothetical protein